MKRTCGGGRRRRRRPVLGMIMLMTLSLMSTTERLTKIQFALSFLLKFRVLPTRTQRGNCNCPHSRMTSGSAVLSGLVKTMATVRSSGKAN